MKNEIFRQDLYEQIEKMEKLLLAVANMVETRFSQLTVKIDNHLRHHEETEKKQSDRIFKIAIVVFQVVLGWLILRKP